ncbi:MAG: hypothetical protein IJ462_02410 [Clostridia bacterium]|nr:hypothetical protein [Clostridia bacterium]
MNSLFETVMLICFGISWPISLIKHYKAKTAKGMSLMFILLIITGYISGIAAKLISHSFSGLVATVYMLNVTMVVLDLAVYFINRHKDHINTHTI